MLNYMFLQKYRFLFKLYNRFFLGCIILSISAIHPIQDFDWREYYSKGNNQFKEERYENALDYYQRAERMIKAGRNLFNPANKELKYVTPAHIFTAIGDCYVRLNSPYRARTYYELSLQLNEKQSKLLSFLAMFYQTRRQYKKSKRFFDLYYKSSEAFSTTYIQYATVLAALKKRAIAISFLESKSKKNNAKRNECLEYDINNKYIKAKNCFINLLYLEPSNTEYYIYLIKYGQYYKNKKNKIYSFVIEGLNDTNQKLKNQIVDNWYFERKNSVNYLWKDPKKMIDPYGFSIYWAKKLYLIFGNKEKYCWPYFYLLIEKRKYRKALRVVKNILKIKPSSLMGNLMLAEIYREKNKINLSNELFNKTMRNK